jgi:rod shape-determining protein MreC
MHNLLEFFTKYCHWFIFIFLEIICVVLLFRFNNYQGSVWFSSANAVSGQLYTWDADIETFFSLTKTNEALTLRNIRLEHQVNSLYNQLLTYTRDTTIVQRNGLEMLSRYKLIPAKVISNSVDKVDNYITIDKGSDDGVKSEMGVACGNGVVGIVYMTSAHYSVVIPVLNSKSNISCAIFRRGYFGYLSWTGGAADEAYVNDIPRHAHFRVGDAMVTSGYSSVFPPGLLVGRILKVFNSPDGLAYRLKIHLSTDFGNLRDVCVIQDFSSYERLQLLKAAQDSLTQKKQN